MTSDSTAHRKQKDENGFTAKGRVVKAFLENPNLSLEEAICVAGEHIKESSVRNWLRNTKRLKEAGLDRDGEITIPKEVLPMWRNALRQRKALA